MAGVMVRISTFALLILLVACESRMPVAPASGNQNPLSTASNSERRHDCVNLNTATAAELDQRLQGVGEVTARKIVEYRERLGPFEKPEEVIIVDGMSERKYRQIASQICVQ
jgi:competence protein ComEA